jgi:hypothetical protein
VVDRVFSRSRTLATSSTVAKRALIVVKLNETESERPPLGIASTEMLADELVIDSELDNFTGQLGVRIDTVAVADQQGAHRPLCHCRGHVPMDGSV